LKLFDIGGFASDSRLADLVKEGILHMCCQLKPEAVAVADSLAPPDFILKSVIGKSDGKVCTMETSPLPDYGIGR
jgi:acyl-CoA oxidase